MRIGLYPFKSTANIAGNLRKIIAAIKEAAEKSVRLLVFHECALCGYPPVESAIQAIHKDEIDAALRQIGTCAAAHKLFVAVGTVRFEGNHRYNSIVLFHENGEIMGFYDKMALWGWDTENYTRGSNPGVFTIDGTQIGFRICFDVRFPEPFRALYRAGVDVCFVCFSDTGETPSPNRYALIKAHLMTRAVENVMTVASVNSLTNFQTAPTAFFDNSGGVLCEAEPSAEQLLFLDYTKPELNFGTRGRVENSDWFLQKNG